ncbi:multidrug resistance protein ABC superfamily [Phytophthora cinnamomi]|uniref:multidrug resistance protein ABC superfamily n=1 Tax=Phytophthora cinnamomi TaxID=4785 RepID=UPI003559FFCA|nr:multidrug resistance protein ABC superfamily [Phytophthora cinnamomi]
MGSTATYVAAETPKTDGETNRLDVAFNRVDNPTQTPPKDNAPAEGKLVSMTELFSYADSVDKLLMFLGTVGGLVAGVGQPIQIVLFGDVLNTFNPASPGSNIEHSIKHVALNFVFVGIAVFVAGSFQVACWTITASRQAKRIRSAYVSAIMTKEIGWFDVNEPMQLATRVAEATVTIQVGMSRKVGDGLNFFSMAVSGIVIGLVKGWQLALILLAFTPFIAVTAFLSMKVLSTATQAGLESYGKAGAVAQEALSNVRTVHMFNSIKHFIAKYESALSLSTTAGIKKGLAVGLGTGVMFGTVFFTYAGGMYFGALMVANDNLDGHHCTGNDCYNGGRVLTVFFSIIMGAMALGQAAPSAEAITAARAAAYPVFQTIKRQSLIDPLSEEGKKLDKNRVASEEQEGSTTEGLQVEELDSPDDHHLTQSGRSPRRSISRHSVSEREGAGKGDDVELGDVDLPPVSMARVWKMSLPEWKFMAAGSLGAIINAAVFPVWGVLLVKVTVLFFRLDYTKSEMMDHARWWALGFVGLGIVFTLSITLQHYGFAVVSQNLVTRVRAATFSAMLHQEIGWFDLDENSSGALVSRLATDSAVLQAMTSETLNRGLVNMTTLTIAFAIAFYYSWQMTLILLAVFPVLALSSYIQAQQMTGSAGNKKNNDADTAAGSLLSEAIGSIRTVASFSMETALNSLYVGYLDVSKEADVRIGVVGGMAFGVSQGAMFLVLAFLFYLSGRWISRGIITFEQMFMVLMVIMLSTFAMGMAAQGATDGATAKRSAQRVFKVIDRKPLIDATSGTGRTLEHVDGDIEFRNLEFTYPARPAAKIYKNYSLKIARGQTVALVGASGSGKSTAISLMERFYDPAAGVVTLDGNNLKELNLQWLREHVSLVSQEPVLFAGTIAENIELGKPGSTREEIIDAAKKANAFDFISNFPSGFDTDVGDRGAQVSGGQKQRIAIARAILRDPAVLLLDEATSALDNESERVVQASLDRLLTLKQRTTIIVAHRLSTIRNANLIAVTHDGAIVEQGTHDQLMQLPNGIYKGLVARQMNAH